MKFVSYLDIVRKNHVEHYNHCNLIVLQFKLSQIKYITKWKNTKNGHTSFFLLILKFHYNNFEVLKILSDHATIGSFYDSILETCTGTT